MVVSILSVIEVVTESTNNVNESNFEPICCSTTYPKLSIDSINRNRIVSIWLVINTMSRFALIFSHSFPL